MSVFSMEIACKILSYLETEDLLNCRFVCKYWNQECLSILGKSINHKQILTSRNIAEFVEFATASRFTPILPFQLTIGDHRIEEILQNIDPLINLYGVGCIDKLRIEAGMTNLTALFEILSKASPGLTSLIFKSVYDTNDPDWDAGPEITAACKRYLSPFVGNEDSGETAASNENEDSGEGASSDENEDSGQIEADEIEGCGNENDDKNEGSENESDDFEDESEDSNGEDPEEVEERETFIKALYIGVVTDLLSQYNFSFPKLKELKYINITECRQQVGPINDLIYRSIVGGCPNLNKLVVPNLNPSLKTSFPVENLQYLEIDYLKANEALLQKYLQNPPTTSTLKVNALDFEDYTHPELEFLFLGNFLKSFANTLTSLRIPLSTYPFNNSSICCLPYLPNLKELELYLPDDDVCILYTTKLNFDPSTLPSLVAVRIPPTCYLVESMIVPAEDSNEKFKCSKSQVCFQNVKHLTLNTEHGFEGPRNAQWRSGEDEEYEDMNMRSGIEHLLQVFPSVTKVTLNNSGNSVVKMLKHLILSPQSLGIRELEILNLMDHHDYIREILKIFEEFQTKATPVFLTNLEKIRLLPYHYLFHFARTIVGDGSVFNLNNSDDHNQTQGTDFSLLSKYMPDLHEIDMPIYPFNYYGESKGQQGFQRMKDIYPQFIFNITYPTPSDCDNFGSIFDY